MIWQLATRSLTLRPLRTFLTALGIAVAVASMVIFLSLGEGVRRVFTEQLGSIGPDLQVSYGDFDTSASLTWVPELPLSYKTELEQNAAEYGILRVVPLMFHFRAGLSTSSSFLFQGIPPGEDVASIYYDYKMLEGRSLTANDMSVAVIGKQVAKRNNLELGKTLRLNREASFEVVGIAESSSGLIDNVILVPLPDLQRAIGVFDKVMYFALELSQPENARDVADQLKERYPELGFQTRGDVLSVAERGIQISDVIRLGISAIALIVGAIAVANTMMMSVFERTREFGVVRAIGAKPRFLFRLVLLESILLSTVGAVVGVILGRLGMMVVNQIANNLIGLDVAALTVRLVIFAVVVALLMGLLSGLLPAFHASRIPIAVAMARE
ncbi:MAG: ABC transporter permease [Trueperaceae bacterium]